MIRGWLLGVVAWAGGSWDSGNGTRLLNGSAPSGWNVFSAISISNNGLILGQGSYDAGPYQWIQLVPALPATPAPPPFVLVLIGVAFWIACYRFVFRLT
jgi:hypothetical protein